MIRSPCANLIARRTGRNLAPNIALQGAHLRTVRKRSFDRLRRGLR